MYYFSRILLRILPWDPWSTSCSKNMVRSCQDSQDVSKRVNPGTYPFNSTKCDHSWHPRDSKRVSPDESMKKLIEKSFDLCEQIKMGTFQVAPSLRVKNHGFKLCIGLVKKMFTITRGPKNLKGTFRAQKTLFFSLETSKQRKVFIFIINFFSKWLCS